MTKSELARAFVAGKSGSCHNARTDGASYTLHHCRVCGEDIAPKRAELGYRICLECGEDAARAERRSWCVAPLHKSNYMLLTDKEDLKGINNKGGLHR
jgi:ribosomal protein L37AE/L43A